MNTAIVLLSAAAGATATAKLVTMALASSPCAMPQVIRYGFLRYRLFPCGECSGCDRQKP